MENNRNIENCEENYIYSPSANIIQNKYRNIGM